jgi:NDP-sugar pyrophosphorylase family protein
MSKALVILAAGTGRRFGGLKQVQAVGPNGEALLEYSAYDARRNGFTRLVIVTRADIEAELREDVGRRIEAQFEVVYVHQELTRTSNHEAPPKGRTKPWGTGHAVLAAIPVIDGPFAVINADDFYGPRSFALIAKELDAIHGGPPGQHVLVGFCLDRTLSEAGTVSRGVCSCNRDGMLIEITERTRIERAGSQIVYLDEKNRAFGLDPSTIVSMNMWGFHQSVFDQLQALFIQFLDSYGSSLNAEFGLPTAVNELIRQRRARVRIVPTPEAWCGMTYEADMLIVQQRVCERIDRSEYPRKLWS